MFQNPSEKSWMDTKNTSNKHMYMNAYFPGMAWHRHFNNKN